MIVKTPPPGGGRQGGGGGMIIAPPQIFYQVLIFFEMQGIVTVSSTSRDMKLLLQKKRVEPGSDNHGRTSPTTTEIT